MADTQGYVVEKPVHILNKAIKADFRELFKALGKAVVNGGSGKWEDMTKSLINAAGALGLEKKIEEVAWLLLYNALTQALFSLVEEHSESFIIAPDEKDLDKIAIDIAATLEFVDIRLTSDFFLCPKNLPLLQDVQDVFTSWLKECFEQNDAEASAMTNRLPT